MSYLYHGFMFGFGGVIGTVAAFVFLCFVCGGIAFRWRKGE